MTSAEIRALLDAKAMQRAALHRETRELETALSLAVKVELAAKAPRPASVFERAFLLVAKEGLPAPVYQRLIETARERVGGDEQV